MVAIYAAISIVAIWQNAHFVQLVEYCLGIDDN